MTHRRWLIADEIPMIGEVISRTRREDGQALVEYALIILLIAVVAVGALTALGSDVSGMLVDIAAAF